MKKVKIVVLDAKPLISDEIDTSKLMQLGDVHIYDNTAASDILLRATDAEIIITNKAKLNATHFAALPKLRYIGETATGVDNIDVKAAKEYNITVTNVPGYSTDSVVQHVLALLLEQTNQVALHNHSVQKKDWQQHSFFAYWLQPVQELAGMTLGLLGYGQVAQKLAQVAKALGMNVLMHKPKPAEDLTAQWVDLHTLLQQSDVLSLHCPLTAATKGIINKQTLAIMKKTAILINTGRGGLIVEEDLAQALQNQQIAAACLDVLSDEPPTLSNPLIGLANCIITPHIAWASVAARKRLLNAVCENIIHFLNQQPLNVIDV